MLNKRNIIILIVVMGLICYFNALGGDFIWDDVNLISNNSLIKNFNNLGKIFTSELLFKSDYYRPLQTLTYQFDYRIYKFAPWGYHLTNIIVHILNALLVFFIFQNITKNPFVPLTGSLLFVCAPFHTEAVTYISGRSDLLLGLFILSAFLSYINGRYIISLLFFVLGLLSREQAMIFPLILILYDLCFKRYVRAKVKYYTLFLIFDILYIVLRLTIFNFTSRPLFFRKNFFSLEIDFFSRILTFLKSIIIYLKIMIIPINLHMERRMDAVKSISDPYVIAFLIILFIFVYLFTKYRGRRELVLFGLLWFFIMLLPQSSLVFPLLLAEHFLYLPCIGIFLISGILLESIWQQRRKFAFVILVSWTLFYSSLSIIQNFNWTNTLTFFRWTLKFSPFSYNAHYCLGNYYADNGLFSSAINEYEKVMEIIGENKDKIWLLPVMHHNIGTMLSRKGLLDEAEKEYKKAIELDPELIDAYNDLGCFYIKRGDIAKAKEVFNEALKVNPKSEKIYYNLGVIYAQKNDFEKASALWKKALEINPNYDVVKAAIKSLKDENQK